VLVVVVVAAHASTIVDCHSLCMLQWGGVPWHCADRNEELPHGTGQ